MKLVVELCERHRGLGKQFHPHKPPLLFPCEVLECPNMGTHLEVIDVNP
jgi:hypothetical protein